MLSLPKFELVNKMKEIFDVKPQFFYTEEFIESVSDINNIAYRADDRKYRKKANMETKYIDYVDYFIKLFESKLNVDSSKIYSLKKVSEKMLYRETKSLEEIAENARKFLDISNNKELLYKLEISGINILEKNMGNYVDAYSTWASKESPYIVLGSVKKSSVRRNFDLAHELGHLLLHSKIDMDNLTIDEYRKVEKEANNFASYFLLPKKEFLKDFSNIKKKSNPKSYLELKMKYNVSITALEYRAYKLGLLSFEENRYFYAKLNKDGMRHVEPFDNDIPIIKPGKIRALLNAVFKNQLIYLDDFLTEHHIESSFLESLLALEEGFLDKYKSNLEYKHYDSNVIDMLSFIE